MSRKHSSPGRRLLSIISESRGREEFTDVELYHDVESFKVHRLIICLQSKVFYKACTGGFEENFTGVVHMQHLSHLELRYMVDFLYDSDYAETESCPLETHIRMFALADQYEIPRLGSLALEKYYDSCMSSWSPEEFLVCIKDIYKATPDSVRALRDTACTVIQKHLPQILRDGNISLLYEETLDEVPEFVKDLLKRYTNNSLYGYCSSCGPGQPMEVLQAKCKTCRKGNTGGQSYYGQ